ncbi:unnamed protein product, partial [Didymodactylos carnosus]
GSKILGKKSLIYLPILGWCWVFTESIFLKRAWQTDKNVLLHDIQQLVDKYPKNYFFTLFCSCEGTRFTEEKRLESMKIAREKNLPELKYHILPRTKGLTLLLQGINKQVTGVLDITVGFTSLDPNPGVQSLINGKRCIAETYI